jgi:response regulator RpfG family c-di-GMP phosphodiesterase
MKKHTILFVDDELNIVATLQRLFRKEGYNILTANSGEAALDHFRENEISLVISDQRMPEMTGVQLLEKVREISPETVRIMLTAYADIKAAVAAINKGEVYRFIGKPWKDEDIKLTVRQALQQLDLKRENERLVVLTERQNEELKTLNSSLEEKVRARTREVEEKNSELEGLYGELKKSFYETIKVMVGLMELLNPPLGGHSKRVAAMSGEVAKRMGLDENEISELETAAILHDIGLMGIPLSVFDKGMKSLSEAEKEMYNQHPVMGQTTLNMIKELKQVGVIVRSHHERFDGKGFPSGLSGEEIPLGARIIAVTDTYDRISKSKEFLSERSARAKAQEEIKAFRGHKYDPEVVEHFFTYLSEEKGVADNERVVKLSELEVGMITSREIITESGRLLLAKNVVIEDVHIKKIETFDKVDPINDNLYAYRQQLKLS